MVIDHDYKCELISRLSKDFKVLSEVGVQGRGHSHFTREVDPHDAQRTRRGILQGHCRSQGERHRGHLSSQWLCPHPTHSQDLVKGGPSRTSCGRRPKRPSRSGSSSKFGANVNLGNIGPADLIPLECLRVGLRGGHLFPFPSRGTQARPPARRHRRMKEIGVLELQAWRQENKAHQLIDIRETYEYDTGNLGGGAHSHGHHHGKAIRIEPGCPRRSAMPIRWPIGGRPDRIGAALRHGQSLQFERRSQGMGSRGGPFHRGCLRCESRAIPKAG